MLSEYILKKEEGLQPIEVDHSRRKGVKRTTVLDHVLDRAIRSSDDSSDIFLGMHAFIS